MIDMHSAAESTQFYYLVAACAYGTLDYVKSLHRAFQKTKDPLPKMLDMATFYNRPEIVEYCIRVGAQSFFRNPHDTNVTGHSDETFKVLCARVLDTNAPIDFYGDILQCAVENNYMDWVRFCLENHVNPASENNSSKHLILAIAASHASIEISELLIAWGAKIKGSSALNIAAHNGRADLVKLLLENGADVDEMGVASIDKDPEDLEGVALHLIEKGREDVLQILLDYGADVNLKDCNGKTVISRMEANGDEILSSMLSLSTFDKLS